MSRGLQPLALQQPRADAPSRYMVSRPPVRACSPSQPVTLSARLEQPLRLCRLPLRWLSGSIPERTCPAAHVLKRGLVRVRNPEGTIRKWCECSELEALLEAGWLLA